MDVKISKMERWTERHMQIPIRRNHEKVQGKSILTSTLILQWFLNTLRDAGSLRGVAPLSHTQGRFEKGAISSH